MSAINENSCSDSDQNPGGLSFDKETRSILFEKLHNAFSLHSRLKQSQNISREVDEFIDCLECIADSIGFYRKYGVEKQQRRRERIESIANHLDGIIDQLKHLDRSAIEYVLMFVWNNPPDHIDKCPPEMQIHLANRAENTAFDIVAGKTVMDELLTYSLNIRNAAKTLPKCLGDLPSLSRYERSPFYPQLGMSIELENLFYKYKIKFTVTNTGLAADCLREIYNLAGLQIDRVVYWLKSARESERSSKNCYYLPQKAHEK